MKYKKSLYIFRRDLRLEDNTALIKALKESEEVICCFIFNKEQVSDKNEYKSNNAIEFMLNSLNELDLELNHKNSKLYFYYDTTVSVIEKINNITKLNAVYSNYDYTSFSIKRDKEISCKCNELKIKFIQTHDYLLLSNPENGLKKDGKPYTIFTPFYKSNFIKEVKFPEKNSYNNYISNEFNLEEEKKDKLFSLILKDKNSSLIIKGGRKEALKILNSIEKFKEYKNERDYPAISKTSHLSAHHKFGTISIRESYYKVKEEFYEEHDLIRQLYWRDFFTQIAYFFPYVLEGKSFQKKYQNINWSTNIEHFNKWCEGKTGYPIVDAGMRELNETGYMHNRTRMIVASFLVKDLHINWSWGEKYFATKLVDYDPCVNNGSWQWAASTGCDAQPYFRIFNPFRQQERFDKDCTYIKKWIPELKDLTPKTIHNLESIRPLNCENYPKLIVNHKQASKIAKDLFIQEK